MTVQIITQEGTPVDDQPEEDASTFEEEFRETAEDVAKDILTGFRKFKNSTILKIGIVAVAIKVVGVAGQIIIENQRLKAALKDRQQQREHGDDK